MQSDFLGRKDFLEHALKLTTDDRNKTHGDAFTQLSQTAEFWSTYLKIPVTAEQVATCIELMKISRSTFGTYNQDDYFDRLGYGAIAGECAEIQRVQDDSKDPDKLAEKIGKEIQLQMRPGNMLAKGGIVDPKTPVI